MTATDVVAWGLDVKNIKCVINYDFPGSMEDSWRSQFCTVKLAVQ
jgi:superfamily II DNA/RNA helicase